MVAHVVLRVDGAPAGDRTRLVVDNPPEGVASALKLAVRLGECSAEPGSAATRDLWEALATLAAIDIGAARAVEPHLDALSILAEADSPVVVAGSDTWGVFAAEGGVEPLVARHSERGWRLDGVKPWCSLAGVLSRALITARLPDGGRGLFAIELRQPGVTVIEHAWHARGLSEIPSGPIHLRDVEATAVGAPNWYLTRPGFAVGGIGVAACWFGGLVAIARAVFDGIGESPSAIQLMQLGRVDGLVESARRALVEAAAAVESRDQADGPILAKRVRAAVAAACEGAIVLAGHALGPAALALDAAHAKRVADLQLYIRQHHAEKDEAALGASLAALGAAPW